MSTTRLTGVTETLLKIIPDLFPLGDHRESVPSDQVHGHLISAIILLATRADVLSDTFPVDGSVHPEALYNRGVDEQVVSREAVKKLKRYRSEFAGVQVAWLDLASYTDPPCLENERMDKLVNFTKTLTPKRKP